MPQLHFETFYSQGLTMFSLCIFFYYFFVIFLIPTFNQSLKLREYLLDDLFIKILYKQHFFKCLINIRSYKNVYLIKWFNIFLPYSCKHINNAIVESMDLFLKKNFYEANNYYKEKNNNYIKIKNVIFLKNLKIKNKI